MKKYILLILSGLIFGSQFMFTKFAIQTLTPIDISMVRTVSGAFVLFLLVPIFARETEVNEHGKISWYMYALIGFLEAVLPCYLIPLGQYKVDSAIAAVLISTLPIFAVIFGAILLKDEKITIKKSLSIIIGFIGVYILIKPPHLASLFRTLLPELFILMASASWALSLVLIKKQPLINPLKLTRNIFVAGAIEIIILWLIIGHPTQFHPSRLSLFSTLLIGIFASGIVYIFYVLLIRYSGVAFAAFSNYIVPIVGIAMGIFFLNEPFFWHQAIGLIVIIAALAIQSLPPLRKRAN
ncbi:MAG: EamA family transporter [Gammaproteobacteria bacterium]|nr:EamA family transporter [Gammaproteobacteria bacterium]